MNRINVQLELWNLFISQLQHRLFCYSMRHYTVCELVFTQNSISCLQSASNDAVAQRTDVRWTHTAHRKHTRGKYSCSTHGENGSCNARKIGQIVVLLTLVPIKYNKNNRKKSTRRVNGCSARGSHTSQNRIKIKTKTERDQQCIWLDDIQYPANGVHYYYRFSLAICERKNTHYDNFIFVCIG